MFRESVRLFYVIYINICVIYSRSRYCSRLPFGDCIKNGCKTRSGRIEDRARTSIRPSCRMGPHSSLPCRRGSSRDTGRLEQPCSRPPAQREWLHCFQSSYAIIITGLINLSTYPSLASTAAASRRWERRRSRGGLGGHWHRGSSRTYLPSTSVDWAQHATIIHTPPLFLSMHSSHPFTITSSCSPDTL